MKLGFQKINNHYEKSVIGYYFSMGHILIKLLFKLAFKTIINCFTNIDII